MADEQLAVQVVVDQPVLLLLAKLDLRFAMMKKNGALRPRFGYSN